MAGSQILIALVLIGTIFASAHAQELSKSFEGVFDIDIAKASAEDHFQNQEISQAKMNITRVGAALVGRVFDLSGEIDVEFQIQFLTQSSGEVFLTRAAGIELDAQDEEESASEIGGGQSIFEFDFANRTGGSFISQSQFKGLGNAKLHKGTYQAILVGRNLVFNVNDGKTQFTINAIKAAEVAEQSFLSRFSLPIMMMVMMFVQRWLRPATQTPGAAPAAAGAAGNGQRRRPAQGSAKVEEIPDAPADKKKD